MLQLQLSTIFGHKARYLILKTSSISRFIRVDLLLPPTAVEAGTSRKRRKRRGRRGWGRLRPSSATGEGGAAPSPSSPPPGGQCQVTEVKVASSEAAAGRIFSHICAPMISLVTRNLPPSLPQQRSGNEDNARNDELARTPATPPPPPQRRSSTRCRR